MHEASDDALVLRYCQGDAAAFDALFERHYTSVYHFARMILGGNDGAEDVLQEAFLAVAQTAATYTPCGRFRGWLLRIVRNRCLNRLDAERVRGRTFGSDGLEVLDPAAADPPPGAAAQACEQATILSRAISALPQRQREALVLYALERMSYAHIAEVLEMPVNTVKTLIHRARVGVAQALAEQDDS